MDALIEAIDTLATSLKRTVGGCSEEETQILDLLEGLLATMQKDPVETSLASDMAQLRHIWTHSIDWCSDLSRQLEKIVILYQEANQAASKTPSPK